MNQVIRSLISLDNLTRTNNASGQVATLLVLLMVILLIFVLATVNIGNLGVQATTLSNAADSAALLLASQLATKGRMMWEGLGNRFEKCQKKSFWGIILAVVFAVVAAVLALFTSGGSLAAYTVFIAAGAGMIGGMIGAAIDGTPIGAGALTGFMIGFAIGSLATAIGGAAGVAGLSEAAVQSALPGLLEGIVLPIVNNAAAFIVLGALSTASSIYYNPNTIYNKSVTLQLEQLQKDMAKLDERDRFQESAFFTALSQMVDNPNKVADADDLDGDGDAQELIPHFYWWWHRRMVEYANVYNAQIPYVQNFLNQMWTFSYIAYCSQEDDGFIQCDSGHYTYLSLRRLDYRYTVDGEGNEALAPGVADGTIVRLLRALRNAGYNMGNWGTAPIPNAPFWDPGPTPAQMDAWLEEDCCSVAEPGCPQCSPPPAGYDWIDDMADHLRGDAAIISEIRAGESPQTTWSSWIYFFFEYGSVVYDENGNIIDFEGRDEFDPDVMYGQLGLYVDMLTALRSRLLSLNLPACNEGWYFNDGWGNMTCGACITGNGHWEWVIFNLQWVPDCGNCVLTPPGWPCRLSNGGITIDENADDELQAALNSINLLIDSMNTFRQQILDFVTNMDSINFSALGGWGGKNPVTYIWTDKRGDNTLKVQAGPWRMPWLKTSSSWRKVCIKLMDYTDGNRAWIKTTRIEPAPPVGSLGRWNPFSAFGRGVSKVSNARYSINYVRIGGITRP